ncbi:MAG: class IV adenylate cyclase [Phycisphaerae bacterium]
MFDSADARLESSIAVIEWSREEAVSNRLRGEAMKEIEAKYRLRDVEKFRQSLISQAFVCAGRVLETNVIFDREQESLRNRGCTLRLRTNHPLTERTIEPSSTSQPSRDMHILTYKGPVEAGRIKIRPEFETSVESAITMEQILSHLGFCPQMLFEKRRETWQGRSCEVVVDELPRLGWFVEIEASCVADVESAARELGLPLADLEPRSYAAMIASILETDSPPCRLTF